MCAFFNCILSSDFAQLGYSVSMFNNTIVAGSPGENAAYILSYQNDTGNFTYEQKLTHPSLVGNDRFGSSVSINGNYVVVGAPQTNISYSADGAVFVFKRGDSNDDLFVSHSYFTSPNPVPNAFFGWSVSVNSNGTIAVGAKGDRAAKGSVYLFKLDVGEWNHVFTLDPDDVTSSFFNDGNFGWNVAIDDS